ncbi:MAG: Undecaprenyl-diphosphatase [Francisellaceae bacterium]|nr:Undecaprenyl-diphosphatase [Francisellaceae bacterium]
MINFFQTTTLAFIQGLTEFLPVSSSAHLILIPRFLGWQDQGLAFDVAVHFGTLFALIYYFYSDLKSLVKGFFSEVKDSRISKNTRFVFFIVVATIPVGLIGLLAKGFVENHLRYPYVVALSTLFFGLILGIADKFSKKNRHSNDIKIIDAIGIGLMQAFALIPGTSRSGITLSAGLFMGLTRETSARFSFLLSIPVIVLAGGLEAFHLIKTMNSIPWLNLAWGIIISFTVGLTTIHFFLKFVNKAGLIPFVIYRIFLSLILFISFGFNK